MSTLTYVSTDRKFCPVAVMPDDGASLDAVRLAFREQMGVSRRTPFCRLDDNESSPHPECLCSGCVIDRFANMRTRRLALGLPVW